MLAFGLHRHSDHHANPCNGLFNGFRLVVAQLAGRRDPEATNALWIGLPVEVTRTSYRTKKPSPAR